ncbi:MAG: AtpZ/AtpI family protein [Acidimicrobiia bacterium]
MGRGFELVLSIVFMGGLGWLLDRWLGTDPFLTIGLAVLGVAGVTAKLWIGYDREMRAHDEGQPWARPTTGGPA